MRESNYKNIILLINYVCLIFPVVTVNMGYYDATRTIVYIFLGFFICEKIIQKQIANASLLVLFISILYNPILSLHEYDLTIWTLSCIVGSALILVFESRNQ
ncbi:MAG: hypothetical protein CFH32_01472 [Alphaproteobacteria bacterium MarineAlpha9_Bin2]|nr:MAG: hypothetical protein CFH32_01472 [Alphaproteobacteria bacterium MarineAlpha9_Bin2]